MYLLSALQGHGTSSWPSASGAPTECTQGTNSPVLAEHVERALAHAGHDPHRDGHVGGVGELHADVGLVRAQRAHRERDHVHRAAAHASRGRGRRACSRISSGSRQLLVGPASSSLCGADEGAVLDARDVGRVRPRQVGVRPLGVGQALEGARVDQLLRQAVVLLGRAVAPVDRVGLGERGDLLDPAHQLRFEVGTAVVSGCSRSSALLRVASRGYRPYRRTPGEGAAGARGRPPEGPSAGRRTGPGQAWSPAPTRACCPAPRSRTTRPRTRPCSGPRWCPASCRRRSSRSGARCR